MIKCLNELIKDVFVKGVFVILMSTVGFLVVGNFVEAQGEYKIHEKIPGQTGGTDQGGEGVDTLQEYLEAAYKFGIAIVAILAVVMIGVGGFMYIVTSAGNAGKLANAKEIITSAILGLVMALLSWLILFVINPDLVGNTLEGVDFDLYNNTWRNDEIADPNICNEEGAIYEADNCEGDYVCLGDTCRNKKSFCSLIGQPKIEGVCHESDFVSQGDGTCGVLLGNSEERTGICYPRECSDGLVETVNGKLCVGINSRCCVRGL